MNIICNLICLEKDRVSVIRLKDEKLEYVKKDGEIDFPITIDFWDWWKRVVSYVDEDSVDICFVFDKNYDLLLNNDVVKYNIINTKKSSWRKEYIKSYFWTLKPTYFNLVIVDPKEQEYVLNGDKKAFSKIFHTNLNFNFGSIKQKLTQDSVNEDTLEEYSTFAKYFIDLIRSERE